MLCNVVHDQPVAFIFIFIATACRSPYRSSFVSVKFFSWSPRLVLVESTPGLRKSWLYCPVTSLQLSPSLMRLPLCFASRGWHCSNFLPLLTPILFGLLGPFFFCFRAIVPRSLSPATESCVQSHWRSWTETFLLLTLRWAVLCRSMPPCASVSARVLHSTPLIYSYCRMYWTYHYGFVPGFRSCFLDR